MSGNVSNSENHMLFDYFLENPHFSYNESHAAVLDHVIDIKTNSIQSAIHECVDKGYFEHISEGIYSLTYTNENREVLTCLLINGENRDLSAIKDNSIDAIITDRPEYLNRFNIDLFIKHNKSAYRFDINDFKEKKRILKPGRFLMEIMPQRDIEDYEKLCKIKSVAQKSDWDYYSNVTWSKMLSDSDEILGKEKIILFSKGAPRDFYMSHAITNNENKEKYTLPTVFDYGKVYQLYSAINVIAQILQFISADNEDFDKQKYLNPKAAVDKSFQVIKGMVIEKSIENYNQLAETIAALREINIATKNMKVAINVAIDALEAFYEGPEAFQIFEKYQLYFGMTLKDAVKELNKLPVFKNENINIAVEKAKNVLNKEKDYPDLYMRSEKYWADRKNSPHTLECSARGDIRFSASHIKLKINGAEKTIENWFNDSKRNKDGNPVNRGDQYEYIVDPFTGDKLFEIDDIQDMYKGLWIAYLSRCPELVEYASKFVAFKDSKYSSTLPIKSSDIISAYVNDKNNFINSIKTGNWYRNIQNKRNRALENQTYNSEVNIEQDKKEKPKEKVSLVR